VARGCLNPSLRNRLDRISEMRKTGSHFCATGSDRSSRGHRFALADIPRHGFEMTMADPARQDDRERSAAGRRRSGGFRVLASCRFAR
jgi:hypothetical protein